MTQFTKCLCFNLTNTLTSYIKLFTHFFECMVGIHINTKTHT